MIASQAEVLSFPGPRAPALCGDVAFDVVGIAASAGGVAAIRQILATLPPQFPAALVVQTHMSPQAPSILADVLAYRSTLPVVWAEHGVLLRPGCVTVIPPGQHLRLGPTGRVTLINWEQLGCIKPHANGLFHSLAIRFGPRAIGVVLTGYLRDGAEGARAITRHGGRVLVQDPATAEVPDMPHATLATGCADFVLPLSALAAALTSLVMVPGAADLFAVPHTTTAQPYRDALLTWPSNNSVMEIRPVRTSSS